MFERMFRKDGRQYDSIVDSIGTMQAGAYAMGLFAAHPGDIDNVADIQRINNSVKFTSPRIGGLVVTGLYSLGGVPGSLGHNSIYAFGPITTRVRWVWLQAT